MIKYKQIKPQTVDVWSDEYGFIGNVNEYEFNDIRIQIKEQKATGYYAFFNGEKYYIDTDGKLDWPNGLFSLMGDQLMILF
jgi:hypothetical protein